MIESNKTLCKLCKSLKTRIADGKYPDKRNTRFVNKNFKAWNGKLCPECAIIQMRERMKRLRFLKKKNETDV